MDTHISNLGRLRFFWPLRPSLIFVLICTALTGVSAFASAAPPDSLTAEVREGADLLGRLVRFRSISGREGKVGRFLAEQCRKEGLAMTIFTSRDSSYNFAASLYPLSERRPNIIFLHHTDVVDAADTAGWKVPPFSGFLSDSAIHGRGTLDAKGMAVMQLMAVRAWIERSRAERLPFNVTLLSVSGEETGGKNGARLVVDKHFSELTPYVVFGEGGSGIPGQIPGKPNLVVYAISVAEKSNLWLQLDLKFRGHGHGAAAPINYANKAFLKALYKLSEVETEIDFIKTTRRMFRRMGKLTGGFDGFLIRHSNWWIFRPALTKMIRREPLIKSLLTNTATLTHLSNPPGPVNQIAPSATAQLDCRLLPGANRKKFIRDIKYGLFEPRFQVSILDECPDATESSVTSAAFKAAEAACHEADPGAEVIPVLFPGSTDNNFFRARGVDVYGLLPIRATREGLESIHGANEHLTYRELERGITFYKALLRHLLHQKGQPTNIP